MKPGIFTQTRITKESAIGQIFHEWSIPEYESFERPKRWYVTMGILAIFLIIYGLFSGNFLFALIIILSAIILFLQDNQAPVSVRIALTGSGVVVGDRLYEYKELGHFYMVYKPPVVKMLFIETNSLFRPTLRIALLDENPLEIRSVLMEYLEEDIEKEEEPMSDTIARDWRIH